MTMFEVVDVRYGKETRHVVRANGPEGAALEALGLHMTRSGSLRNLACKVYWEADPGSRNMVRLYLPVAHAGDTFKKCSSGA